MKFIRILKYDFYSTAIDRKKLKCECDNFEWRHCKDILAIIFQNKFMMTATIYYKNKNKISTKNGIRLQFLLLTF